ncbi:hypothetical protein EPD60_12270 [Flaviaesturariibacter flavus]|uniref:Uncharacterized protein n=1 Tax=Flaviaesturariibacter flavus TaxID=2502780 RepID=A0A4R1B9H3_9BACT|nr:hypothetical protein [Flaviaesturariibacter flavus]TCJ13566.1 hypothetical protein EPD60_12270 [Flaviaesturariibacter flavus]
MSQSTDEIILRAAWKLVWTPNTPYYLPDVLRNGVHSGNINIPALEGAAVGDIGPINLFKDDVLGYITVRMMNNTVSGLSSITDGGLDYNDGTKTLRLTVGFGGLSFKGSYEVASGGVTGCAIASANSVLNVFRSLKATGEDDPNINLAYQYRDRLTQPDNPNGNLLVNTFYDQNDTINTVVLAQNAMVGGKVNKTNGMFHNAWLKHTTNGQDTSYYMNNTSNAAKNPDSGGSGFNDDDYNSHGFYMETLLTYEAVNLRNLGDPRGEALYNSIKSNSSNGSESLEDHAKGYTGSSVGDFMGYVKEGGVTARMQARAIAPELLQRKQSLYEDARAAAQAHYEDWIANDRHEEFLNTTARFASVNDIVQLTGHFTDNFSIPAVTLIAGISTTGGNLTVSISDIQAHIGALNIELQPDKASDLNTRVQNGIANAGFMQSLMKTKVENAINSNDVKTYLSGRLNDAIRKIFG